MTSGPSSRDRRRGHTLDQLCCRPRRCAAAIVPDVESGGHPSTVRDAADAIRVAFDHQCPLCWSRPGVGVFIRAAPSSEVQSHVDDHVPLAVDVAELAASAEDVVSLRGTLGEEGGMSRRRLPNPGRWHCGPSWASVGGRARGPPRRRRDQRRPVRVDTEPVEDGGKHLGRGVARAGAEGAQRAVDIADASLLRDDPAALELDEEVRADVLRIDDCRCHTR